MNLDEWEKKQGHGQANGKPQPEPIEGRVLVQIFEPAPRSRFAVSAIAAAGRRGHQ